MNEREPWAVEEYTPPETLSKQGVAAVGHLAGGALLLVMQVLGARFRLLGVVLALVSGGMGLSAMHSRDPGDKKAGIILTAAGVLELVAQFGVIGGLKAIASTLLGVGALGLLAVGVVKGWKFLKGLKARG